MKKVSKIIIIILLIALIGFSGLKLWDISAVYLHEAQIKDKLLTYRPDSQDPINSANHPDSQNQYHPVELTSSFSSGGGDESDETADNAMVAEGSINSGTEGGVSSGASSGASQYRPIVNRSIVDLQNEVNRNAIGWITVPNTHIDYPFVSCDDNNYYLDRNIYGNSAPAGTLFMDQCCAGDLSDFNTIIYGHNMRNNTMFGDLPKFADEWFFNSNQSGTLYTEYGVYDLEIFAFLIVRAGDPTIYTPSVDSDAFYKYVKEHARNYRQPDAGLPVVTLSTCGYEFTGARIVVVANIVA